MKNFTTLAILTSSGLLAPALTFLPVTDIATPNMLEGNQAGNPLSNIIEGAGFGFDANEPHTRPRDLVYRRPRRVSLRLYHVQSRR